MGAVNSECYVIEKSESVRVGAPWAAILGNCGCVQAIFTLYQVLWEVPRTWERLCPPEDPKERAPSGSFQNIS